MNVNTFDFVHTTIYHFGSKKILFTSPFNSYFPIIFLLKIILITKNKYTYKKNWTYSFSGMSHIDRPIITNDFSHIRQGTTMIQMKMTKNNHLKTPKTNLIITQSRNSVSVPLSVMYPKSGKRLYQ